MFQPVSFKKKTAELKKLIGLEPVSLISRSVQSVLQEAASPSCHTTRGGESIRPLRVPDRNIQKLLNSCFPPVTLTFDP